MYFFFPSFFAIGHCASTNGVASLALPTHASLRRARQRDYVCAALALIYRAAVGQLVVVVVASARTLLTALSISDLFLFLSVFSPCLIAAFAALIAVMCCAIAATVCAVVVVVVLGICVCASLSFESLV